MKTKKWYEYLWIATLVYFSLGLFNILFAWLGLIFFVTPLVIAIVHGSKAYCNRYCDRGQLFDLLGKRVSRQKESPVFLRKKWFRYGFMTFFLVLFISMLVSTYLVFSGVNGLREVVTLLWTFQVPWEFAYSAKLEPTWAWVAQFAFGFYSIMLTSTILGLVSMVVYKPRTWCVFCPMGTMTQLICKIKNESKIDRGI